MAKENQNQNQTQTQNQNQNQTQTWGTWEELLLACAVKRHGSKNWDTVAMELRSKTSLPHVMATAANCEQKYRDLNRRFTTTQKHVYVEHAEKNDGGDDDGVDGGDNIPWIEELRKLRVAELKQEVQRYDVSILSLQLKVKGLEEESERNLEENGNTQESPDLKPEGSEKDQTNEPNKKVLVCGDESDRENRSVNESNSTASDRKGSEKNGVKLEDEPVHTGSGERDPVSSGSDSKPYDSVTQLSSEVQSSTSLGRKGRRNGRRRKEIEGDGVKEVAVKAEPMIGLLEMIRAHKHGSLFEGRLESQETDVYRKMIRQHLDLETIQARLDQGSYSSSHLSFYRDLLLLFNNAVLFFPNSSVQSQAACELRSLVSNEIKKEVQRSDSTVAETPKSDSTPAAHNLPPQPETKLERSDSLLAKHKSSGPIIFSRKRSSISVKPSSSGLGQQVEKQKQLNSDNKRAGDLKPPVAEQSLLEMKTKDKPVTGTRSSRRSDRSTSNEKQTAGPATKLDKLETPKTDKKKIEELIEEKKRSAADFLKRIKKNSPVATLKRNSRGVGNSGGERKKDRRGKQEKGKEKVQRKNGDRRQVKEESSPSKKSVERPSKKGVQASRAPGKRGREGGGKEAVKKPRKRTRR